MTLEENLTRPPECCGVCPPTTTGYDCTCAGNPRCEGPNRRPPVTTIPDDAIEAAEHAFKESLRSQHIPVTSSWAEELRVAIEAALPWLQATKNGGDQ